MNEERCIWMQVCVGYLAWGADVRSGGLGTCRRRKEPMLGREAEQQLHKSADEHQIRNFGLFLLTRRLVIRYVYVLGLCTITPAL